MLCGKLEANKLNSVAPEGCWFFGIGGFMIWGGGQRFFSVFNAEEIRICCSIAFQEASSLVLLVPAQKTGKNNVSFLSLSSVNFISLRYLELPTVCLFTDGCF